MAGGKLTPRQKMINMMYLVLTALLAMNVSAEVLEAFRLVETGIENSNDVLREKVTFVDAAFQGKMSDSPDGPMLYEQTKKVSAAAGDLNSFIDQLKEELYTLSGKTEEGHLEKMDDIDSPSRLLAMEDAVEFKGKQLQEKINNVKAEITEIINTTPGFLDSERLALVNSLTLTAEDDPNKKGIEGKWYYKNFFHVPSAGTMTILTKLQNDALSAEATVNEAILKTIGALDFKFDKLRATVQAEKAYLPGGSTYESNIFLTASSSGIVAETYVGSLDMSKFEKDSLGDYIPFNSETETPFNGEPKLVPNGKYSAGTSVGQNGYKGAIKIANPKGGFDWYPFESTYEGAAPGGFSVSPTKMNVLYIGVPNPLSITLGDAKPGSEKVSISQGSISKSGTGWVATVNSVGEATISVGGTAPSGEAVKTQSANFRVKLIPDPIPTLGGDEVLTTNGKGQKGTLKAKGGIVPLLKDFDFEARFNVISYDFYLTSGGELLPARGNNGPLYSSGVSNLLDRAKPNDLVVFDNIKVQGPDGKTRKIPSMTFQII
ncbi:MAG: gliding motility protein GldM [Chitinophagales bacterium]|nr:gliding motility protein GldM [Chitinophagales bacterium]